MTSFILFILFCTYQLIACEEVAANLTRLTSARSAFAPIEAGNKLYFAGGFEYNDNVASKKIDVYDLDKQLWEELNLTEARGFITPLVIEPHIYFISGIEVINSLYFFSEIEGTFIKLPTKGPTVTSPQKFSLFNSILTVVGYSSVDFYNTLNHTWYYYPKLTSLTNQLVGAIIFSNEDLIFVLGGFDTLTREQTISAHIFNTTSQGYQNFTGVIPINDFFDVEFDFIVSDRIVIVWINDLTTLIMFNMDTLEWYHNSEIDVLTALTFPKRTFVSAGDRLAIFDWSETPVQVEEFFQLGSTNSRVLFKVNGEIVYIYQNSTAWLNIFYQNGTSESIKRILSFQFGRPDILPVPTGSKFVAIPVSNTAISIYDPETRAFPSGYLTEGDISHFISINSTTFGVVYYDTGDNIQLRIITYPFVDITIPFFEPDLIFGNLIIQISGKYLDLSDPLLNVKSMNTSNLFGSYIFTKDSNNLVVVERYERNLVEGNAKVYKKIDVYNYINSTWEPSIDILEFLFEVFEPTFMAAAVVDRNLLFWRQTSFAIYDTDAHEWIFEVTSPKITSMPFPVYSPVPVINGEAYVFMETGNPRFTRFQPKISGWPTTSEPSQAYPVRQRVQYKNEKIFLSTFTSSAINPLFSIIYSYDIGSDSWDTKLIQAEQYATIGISGEFLVVIGSSGRLQYYYIPATTQNFFEQSFNYTIRPSAIIETSRGLTFIAGGSDSLFGHVYSDLVYIFAQDSFVVPPIEPIEMSEPSSNLYSNGLTTDNIITIVVVIVGSALIAGGLIAFFLIRKRKKQRNNKKIRMTGLEEQYGKWFTKFEDIKFGTQLGQGANGQVFKGTWKGTTVALKVSATVANSSVVAELELMLKMRPHPNVVQLLGFSIHPETKSIILLLEYCGGGSLDNILLEKNKSVVMNQKLSWLKDIASGINHLYANNIVHRDIAARNVLLHSNEAKITDFGMSRLIDEDKQRGTTKSELGPIRWMAPECLKSKEYSIKSDAWSFGILMYEVIAEEEPHTNADPIEIGRLIRDQALTPMIPPTCPPALASLMQKCWRRDTQLRPNFDQILQELEAITL